MLAVQNVLLQQGEEGLHRRVVPGSAGRTPYPLVPDARPETIRASVEGSLQRLRTDRIDLRFQHGQDPDVPVEEVAGTVGDLICQGKVLHWGLSEVDEATIRRAHALTPLAAVENRCSMMARGHEELFGPLEELGIGFVAFSPMVNGFLTGAFRDGASFDADSGDYRAAMPQFTREAAAANAALLALLDRAAADRRATPGQISLAWMLGKRPWIVPIPGSRDPGRLKENAAAADVVLYAREVADLDAALDRMTMSDVFGVRSSND